MMNNSSLIKNQTRHFEDLPPNRLPVSCKWVLRKKYNSDGSILKYKARLVARGYSQEPSLDYHETFSPMLKVASLRLLFALAAILDLEIHQMDVRKAFLNGTLQEVIYMLQPEGHILKGFVKLRQLLKTLYGLKQPPRAWYERMDSILLRIGFYQKLS